MNEQELITYYNKFNEDKRLNSRHGQIEFHTAMQYIHKYLAKIENPKIIDIGAGTGKYAIALANEGYNVTAVELVKHNLRVIEKNSDLVKAYQGNAIDLSRFKDNSFDVVILFGPLYHLLSQEDKVKALNEAKRIVKPEGYIFNAYCMNDYCVIMHGFKDGFIKSCLKDQSLDEFYHCIAHDHDLYSVVRLEEIDELNRLCALKRVQIFTPDGPTDYMRSTINQMDEETFALFLDYHLATCERLDMLGAASHVVDIVKK